MIRDYGFEPYAPPAPKRASPRYSSSWTGRAVLKQWEDEDCAVVLKLDGLPGQYAGIHMQGKPLTRLFYYYVIELGELVTVLGRQTKDGNLGSELRIPGIEMTLRVEMASDIARAQVGLPIFLQEVEPSYAEKLGLKSLY